MSAPTALYRRYRPDSFATVIGQEHVTAPLMTALDKNRVNHAYLFSGPRGCGKTTSARILARCLNCAKGPTSHPCGECDSCVELARGGAGSLDVIEIDAASHGGVDDARDLRERATFAPIRDRYKIFIIDEAHMVTSAGFNALLKIVEEPPEHIKFIFATTEPDKVIGTIRSRTHHYPFRLVPPEPLMAYLAQLCEQEHVTVAPGVLSLVVRAGGGSVRDSLSVLDQLMAGAADSGLNYDLAVDLLGYTHSSLLDDVVEALAAADSATVFKSVDRVIQTGHDPRRFVEDLLERFRDLIIVQAMPESAHAILRGTPDELIARMQTQAAQLGAAELSRAADVTNAAFNDMTGASSPRLHLELLGARLLLPGTDSSVRGIGTRLDQLERRLNYSGAPSTAAGAPPMAAPVAEAPIASPGFASSGTTAPADPAGGNSSGGLAAVRAQLARAKEAAGAAITARHAFDEAPEGANPPSSTATQAPENQPPAAVAQTQNPVTAESGPSQSTATAGRSWDDLPTPASDPQMPPAQAASVEPLPAATQPAPAQQGAPAPSHAQTSAQPVPEPAPSAPAGSSGIEVIRRAWPEILGALRNIRMASWVIVNQNVVPQTFDGQELRVGLPSSGLIGTFSNGGHLQNLQQAINQVLGLSIQILPVDGEAPKASAEPNPKAPTGNPSPHQEGPSAAKPTPRDSDPTPAAPAPARPASVQAPVEAPAQAIPAVRAPQRPSPAAATPVNQAPEIQAPWDGPTEPSDPWDEPHPDSYPPEDAYSGVSLEPQANLAPVQATVPSTPLVHTPPKVSPIAAWTTGWDTPAAEPEEVAPVTPAGPSRSERLAQQIAAQGNQGAPQDWGVSLGQNSRNAVADPGWGAIAEAPDWAQGDTPVSSDAASSSTAEATGGKSQPAAQNNAQISAANTYPAVTPAVAVPADATATIEPTDAPVDVPFNAALPVAGQPLGASSAYPTPAAQAQAPAPASLVPAQPAPQRQEAPASDVAAPAANSTEKLSMYQRLSNSSEAQAGRAKAPAVAAATTYVEDVPSPDDVTIEESGVVGQAAVERILGGVLVDERPLTPGN